MTQIETFYEFINYSFLHNYQNNLRAVFIFRTYMTPSRVKNLGIAVFMGKIDIFDRMEIK